MSNKLPIEITADDAVIATIKRINAQLDRLSRPVKQLQQYTTKLAKVSGLDRLVKSTRKLAGAARSATSHVAALLGPVTALIGGGTLAGLAAFTDKWASMNFYIDRTARSVGLTTAGLQALRGTATALGIDANEVGASFQNFDDILQGAQFGRNPQALVMMNRLGISVRRTKDGAIDTADAFKQLSGAVSRLKGPEVQRLVAREFGMESMLPLLKAGPAAIDAYNRKVRELGGVQTEAQVAAADRLATSLNLLKVAAGGLQNEIASRLAPGFTAFVEHLTDWISANRQRIGDFFTGLGAWLGKLDFNKLADGANHFLDKLLKVIDGLGGFKTVAIALGGVMLVNLLAPFASLLASAVVLAPALAAAWPILAAIAGLSVAGAGIYMARQFMQENPNGINVGGGHGIGARQNNPTNLRSWGLQPTNNGFAVFGSPLDGLTAAAKQLELYGGRGNDTLRGIISKWAPKADGNDVEGYIHDAAKETGLDPELHQNLKDPSVLSPILTAIVHKESGKDYPLDPDVLRQAVTAGIAAAGPQKLELTFRGLPMGVRPTANAPGNVSFGASMPDSGH